jgi:PAS domain-containing protein
MNEYQPGVVDTVERTRGEKHIEGVREQGGFFVEAVRVTRMPMIVTDALLPGNPILFANAAFTALSGYDVEEITGQDPHFMNGPDTDPDAVQEYKKAIEERRDSTMRSSSTARTAAPFTPCCLRAPW